MDSVAPPVIRVSCAIIEKKGVVLAAQRGTEMAMPLKWELPGGKIEEHESPENCLKREIFEEMGVEIVILSPLGQFIHHYPAFTIRLYPFICSITGEKIHLREHAAIAWLSPADLKSLDWAEADLPVIDAYCRSLQSRKS